MEVIDDWFVTFGAIFGAILAITSHCFLNSQKKDVMVK
jgi:hypothetical protein